jgi:hypothetical protein
MAWAEHSGWLTAPGGVALGATSALLNHGNLDLLRQIGEEYAKYRQSGGSITRGQYDYRRKVLIERFAQNMGPVERLLFRGATTSQAVRIARAGGVPHDHHIQRQVGKLRQLSSLASKGGILLAGVGIAAACAQIAGAAGQGKKNEIFVDAITSTFVGAALGFFVVSNPIPPAESRQATTDHALVRPQPSDVAELACAKLGRFADRKLGRPPP